MPENYLQNKEFTWVFRFLLFRSSNKIFKKKVLGVQRTPHPLVSERLVLAVNYANDHFHKISYKVVNKNTLNKTKKNLFYDNLNL